VNTSSVYRNGYRFGPPIESNSDDMAFGCAYFKLKRHGLVYTHDVRT
jgi:hypothetical protein